MSWGGHGGSGGDGVWVGIAALTDPHGVRTCVILSVGAPGGFSAEMSQRVSCLGSTGGSGHGTCLFAASCMMTSAAKFPKSFFSVCFVFFFSCSETKLETKRENSSSEFHIGQVCVCVCVSGCSVSCVLPVLLTTSRCFPVQRHRRFPVDPFERSISRHTLLLLLVG